MIQTCHRRDDRESRHASYCENHIYAISWESCDKLVLTLTKEKLFTTTKDLINPTWEYLPPVIRDHDERDKPVRKVEFSSTPQMKSSHKLIFQSWISGTKVLLGTHEYRYSTIQLKSEDAIRLTDRKGRSYASVEVGKSKNNCSILT